MNIAAKGTLGLWALGQERAGHTGDRWTNAPRPSSNVPLT